MKFQFHKGTIRTKRTTTFRQSLSEFQFHKGTIRTQQHFLQDDCLINFNSIKVQLERFKSEIIKELVIISIP